MTTPAPSLPPRARFTGLDGLRAVAVVLVVVYHLFPGWWLRSGFIGVDVFFVISGFLITSLLLRERERTGRIALVDFWRRRARRLLPALALLVTVTATWAWMIGGDVLVRLGWQVAGAITFSYNWVSVAGGSDYFTAGTPELLRNLWSLAVEEQFYLVWPLLLLVLLFLPRRWARAAASLAAAVASAWWMAAVVSGGGGLTRAYFGTDTHAFGLLLGVALAVGLQRVLTAPPAWMLRTGARATGAAVGTVALAGLFAIALLPEQPDTITFPGTLAAASVLTAIVIVAGTAAGSALGPALDAGPLRWIGDRSYSIYLWHWPLLVLIAAMTGRTAGSDPLPAWIGGLVLVLTVLCAAASHRFVEQPVRRYGFRGSLRRLHRHLVGPPGARLRAIGVLVGGAAVIAGTTAAIQVAPAESSAQSVVQAGQRALEQDAGPRPPLLAADQADHPSGGAAPAAVTGAQIDAIGDSVMLASAPALMQRYPGIHIDAKVSRSMWTAPGLVDALVRDRALRRYVVLGLGTNGAIDRGSLDHVVAALGPRRHLVLVTAYADRSWIPGVNRALRDYAAAHPEVIVADWAAAIDPHRQLLAGDGIHPGEAGGRIYARTVADAIDAAQRAHAAQHEQMVLRACRLAQPTDIAL
nr:acyltransferase family protein [Microbacterium bovistercoris]